ncbi:ZIP family zinc transporter [Pseudomonas duriflava]|uniref:ZIP family zinc transporter n=1 Tax=Pseudomonas duriflava TaxID=459528 RepID=A0A562QF54_9PSED|nr:ZIP family metal transporter [Pseudomonas duriflava]TWI55387.1 ZIP family zinc transporter [Pseudomonas duriflava]
MRAFQAFLTTNIRWALLFTLLCVTVFLVQLEELRQLFQAAPMRAALQGGLLCALGTALGALPVLALARVSERFSNALLGFGAGVMLAATAFSLLIPALAASGDLGYSKWGSGGLVSAGLCLGVMGMLALERIMPAQELSEGERTSIVSPRILLFVAAIVLHNIPEGMAVGVAEGASLEGADSLALGIALQDFPEGMVIALVLAGAGVNRFKAVGIGAASGLVEPLFAVISAWLVSISQLLLPWGLALAAGAMLFAVTHEVIPETHIRKGYKTSATVGLAIGFCLMMVMDTALG